MYERFTERARQVVVVAQDEARKNGNTEIGTAHLVGALIAEEEGLAARILESLDVHLELVRGRYPVGSTVPVVGQVPFTGAAKKTLEFALREALSLGHNYIGTEHILLAVAPMIEWVDWPGEKARSEVMRLLRASPPVTRAEVVSARDRVLDQAELSEKVERLSLLQMELAVRGFFSSLSTFRFSGSDDAVAPSGDRELRTMAGWHARVNVVYQRFNRESMDVLAGLAADYGCMLEWSQKHGATFYPLDPDDTQSKAVMTG